MKKHSLDTCGVRLLAANEDRQAAVHCTVEVSRLICDARCDLHDLLKNKHQLTRLLRETNLH